MPSCWVDRIIMFSVIGLVAWAIIGLPLLYGPTRLRGDANQPPQAHPAQSEQNRAQKPDGSENAPFFIRIPKTAEETANEADERKEKASTDRWLMIFTGAVAFFTFLLVGATGLLYRAGERQLALTADTAKRQLRAYVFIEGPGGTFTSDAVGNRTGFRIFPHWKNCGQTPAMNAVAVTAITIQNQLVGDGFEPPLFNRPMVPLVINPGIKVVGGALSLTIAEFDAIVQGARFLYIYGFCEYDDTFTDTDRHGFGYFSRVTIEPTNNGEYTIGFQSHTLQRGYYEIRRGVRTRWTTQGHEEI